MTRIAKMTGGAGIESRTILAGPGYPFGIEASPIYQSLRVKYRAHGVVVQSGTYTDNQTGAQLPYTLTTTTDITVERAFERIDLSELTPVSAIAGGGVDIISFDRYAIPRGKFCAQVTGQDLRIIYSGEGRAFPSRQAPVFYSVGWDTPTAGTITVVDTRPGSSYSGTTIVSGQIGLPAFIWPMVELGEDGQPVPGTPSRYGPEKFGFAGEKWSVDCATWSPAQWRDLTLLGKVSFSDYDDATDPLNGITGGVTYEREFEFAGGYSPGASGVSAPNTSSNGGTSPGSNAPAGGGLVTPVGGSGPIGGTPSGGSNAPSSKFGGNGLGAGPSGPVVNGGKIGGIPDGPTNNNFGGGSANGPSGPVVNGGKIGADHSGYGPKGPMVNGGKIGGIPDGPSGPKQNGGKIGGIPNGPTNSKDTTQPDKTTIPKTNPLDAERARREREKNAERNRKWPQPIPPWKRPKPRPPDLAPYWTGLLWQDFLTVTGTTVKLAVDFLPLTGAYPRTANEVAIWFSNRGILRQDVKFIRDGVLVGSNLVGALPGSPATVYNPGQAGFTMTTETEVTLWNPFTDAHTVGGLRLLLKN